MNILTTPYEKDLGEIPYNIYPRPQLKRDSFICLNGKWNLRVERDDDIAFEWIINVPFPIEAKLSGVDFKPEIGDVLLYSRRFNVDEDLGSDRLILHLGAVDQICQVFINGKRVCENEGGYLPFSCDITKHLRKENRILVRVIDDLNPDYPYGKQKKDRGGMWYTPVSGIWQTVWLERVPESYIKNMKITTFGAGVCLDFEGGHSTKRLTVKTDSGEKIYDFFGESFEFEIENPEFWSPESPRLYEFSVECGEDKIESYFALRTIGIGSFKNGRCLMLNGKPYFFNGLLDQGYFSDGIYLPATEKGFIDDIKKMKLLGFNTLRKHCKIEPDLFYYYCDLYGMVVFQDIVNSGKYSFMRDTALPTVKIRRLIKPKISAKRKEIFYRTAVGTVNHLYNHPSVCYYTIFNEGWGQFETTRYYNRLKGLDPTRIYDSFSGWFKEGRSDVQSEHIYFRPISFRKHFRKPIILSEFGGYCFKIDRHSFNPDKTFGYKICKTEEEFKEGLKRLYGKEVLRGVKKGLCGAVLTQVSDVEDETNGLLTFDRQLQKIPPDTLKEEFAQIQTAFKVRFDGE